MRSVALKLIVLCLSLVAGTATYAQTADAPAVTAGRLGSAPIEARPPVVNGTGLAGYQSQPERIATPVANPPASAVPPPDPTVLKWGDYSQPRPVPLALPPVVYDLAGPPRGFVQPNFGQDYRQVIGDPNNVAAVDAGLTRGIDLARPDGIAPAGVRGDHTLRTGRVLLSVRYDQESYDDLFMSSHRVSSASILANFPFAPRRLFQNRETALLEYGVTDDFTFLMTLPFEHSRQDYLDAGGGSSSTSFGNPGDIKITGLYVLFREPGQQLHLNFGINFPTGFLDYQNVQPSPTFPNLPYVIRTSSGTYDLLPGLTYRGQNEFWSWGAQATADIHLGLNRAGYELGDQVNLTAWLSRRMTERWGASVRIDGQGVGNVRGADPRLNTALAPTNRPDMQGGAQLNLLFGINYFLPAERIPGQVFSIEVGAPVFQSLEGPQLGLDWTLISGWNLMF